MKNLLSIALFFILSSIVSCGQTGTFDYIKDKKQRVIYQNFYDSVLIVEKLKYDESKKLPPNYKILIQNFDYYDSLFLLKRNLTMENTEKKDFFIDSLLNMGYKIGSDEGSDILYLGPKWMDESEDYYFGDFRTFLKGDLEELIDEKIEDWELSNCFIAILLKCKTFDEILEFFYKSYKIGYRIKIKKNAFYFYLSSDSLGNNKQKEWIEYVGKFGIMSNVDRPIYSNYLLNKN